MVNFKPWLRSLCKGEHGSCGMQQIQHFYYILLCYSEQCTRLIFGLVTPQTKTAIVLKTNPLTFPKRTGGVCHMHCCIILKLDGDEQLTFGEGQRILIGICIDSQVIEAIGEGWAIFLIHEKLKPFSLRVRPSVNNTTAYLVSFHN